MPGAICTLILAIIICVFATIKVITLFNRSDFNVMSETHDYYFDETFQFSSKEGFRVAATVVAPGDTDLKLDPSIGTLKFYLKTWSEQDDETLSFYELN